MFYVLSASSLLNVSLYHNIQFLGKVDSEIYIENFALWTHPIALLRIPFVRRLQVEQQDCRITVEMGKNCCRNSWEA